MNAWWNVTIDTSRMRAQTFGFRIQKSTFTIKDKTVTGFLVFNKDGKPVGFVGKGRNRVLLVKPPESSSP